MKRYGDVRPRESVSKMIYHLRDKKEPNAPLHGDLFHSEESKATFKVETKDGEKRFTFRFKSESLEGQFNSRDTAISSDKEAMAVPDLYIKDIDLYYKGTSAYKYVNSEGVIYCVFVTKDSIATVHDKRSVEQVELTLVKMTNDGFNFEPILQFYYLTYFKYKRIVLCTHNWLCDFPYKSGMPMSDVLTKAVFSEFKKTGYPLNIEMEPVTLSSNPFTKVVRVGGIYEDLYMYFRDQKLIWYSSYDYPWPLRQIIKAAKEFNTNKEEEK